MSEGDEVIVCRVCGEEHAWFDSIYRMFQCPKCYARNSYWKTYPAGSPNSRKRVPANIDPTQERVWCHKCKREHIRPTATKETFQCIACGCKAITGASPCLISEEMPKLGGVGHEATPRLLRAIEYIKEGSKLPNGTKQYRLAINMLQTEIHILEKYT